RGGRGRIRGAGRRPGAGTGRLGGRRAATPAHALALREDGVLRVARRLEAGLEDRPAKRRLTCEDERAAGDGREPASLRAEREQTGTTERARFGELRVATGLAFAVRLADHPEASLHRKHQGVLDHGSADREPA